MKDQVLALDALLKLALGLLLAGLPKATIALCGLPKSPETTFWPRLVGALLIGIAVAAGMQARWASTSGLGLAGAFTVNMTLAFALATGAAVGRLQIPRRGRWLLWTAVLALVMLALVELAWI